MIDPRNPELAARLIMADLGIGNPPYARAPRLEDNWLRTAESFLVAWARNNKERK